MSKEPLFGPGGRPVKDPPLPPITNITKGRPRQLLQKWCQDCSGTGRIDFGDGCVSRCDMCGGEGMLP